MFLSNTGNIAVEYEDKKKKKIIITGIIQEEVDTMILECESLIELNSILCENKKDIYETLQILSILQTQYPIFVLSCDSQAKVHLSRVIQ